MIRYRISSQIEKHPQPQDVGMIRFTATVFPELDNPRTFTTESYATDFLDDDYDECPSKHELDAFLSDDADINQHHVDDALMNLIDHVAQVTCPASSEYSPRCALNVWLAFYPDDDPEVENPEDEDDPQMEEAVQASFDETRNTRLRPASKHVVKSLTRKVYNKKIRKQNNKTIIYKDSSLEECTICLEEFSHGGRVVTLPCGHEFDDECIIKWFETSHVCPLCRYELPCEDH